MLSDPTSACNYATSMDRLFPFENTQNSPKLCKFAHLFWLRHENEKKFSVDFFLRIHRREIKTIKVAETKWNVKNDGEVFLGELEAVSRFHRVIGGWPDVPPFPWSYQ